LGLWPEHDIDDTILDEIAWLRLVPATIVVRQLSAAHTRLMP
jgi:hypothetical protein